MVFHEAWHYSERKDGGLRTYVSIFRTFQLKILETTESHSKSFYLLDHLLLKCHGNKSCATASQICAV